MLSAVAASAADIEIPAPENPATGIWIQQIGDIVPHAATKATLYYTKFRQSDRVKSISYQYDGAGYLLMKPSDKKTLCTTSDGMVGADGSDAAIVECLAQHKLVYGTLDGGVHLNPGT